MSRIRFLAASAALFLTFTSAPPARVSAGGQDGKSLIHPEELKKNLAYFSSDQFEGRSTFSEGLGLAAAWIADQLESCGVRPAGDDGSYFQRVRVIGVKSDNHSTLTVEANGETRTFKNGEGITFPENVGAPRSFTSDQIEFLGYGLVAPSENHDDYAGKDAKHKVVVWLGSSGPEKIDQQRYRRLLSGRARLATEQQGALASIGPMTRRMRPQQQREEQAAGGFRGGPRIEAADFTTVQRLDHPVAPTVSAEDDFFSFLFQGQEVAYRELKTLAEQRKPLPAFSLKNVRITFNLDADYRIVRTQFTRNVVGIVEGSDPKLKGTYVAFGAHYDHMGYAEGEIVETPDGPRRAEPRGRVKEGALEDRIWNGADDDGSGTIGILAVAKAFAQGPRPKRSLLFVFHTGEERGLYGSRYYADYPTVPIESIVADVNLDMIGRNRDDKAEEANKVYVVGSDRISTELHNITIDAAAASNTPLDLDFEMNDPADLEQVYYRSDHYSYAAKGIPAVFLTTGMHPDYHYNTDSAEKIDYEKMARIVQFTYDIGLRVANLDHAPVRDNRGPRAGKGTHGKLQN